MTLRGRLLLASVIILAIVALGALLLLRTQRSFLTDQVDDQLDAARPLVQFRPPGVGDLERPPPDAPVSNLFIGSIDDNRLITVLKGQLLDDTPQIDTSTSRMAAVTEGEPFTVGGQKGRARFRVAVVQPPTAETASVIALPLDEVDGAIGRLQWTLGAGIAVISGVLILAMWWVERLGLRPVARLTAAADAISHGDRDRRVLDADPRTEAGKLASAFNVMLDERDDTEARLRQFVADASHELRTPLTSIRGYLDLYREGGFRDDGELDDMVRRMLRESNRMQDLVEDLLLLANLDEGRPLQREPVDVGRLLRDAAMDTKALQPDRPVIVEIHGDEPLEAIGDPFRLQQVVGVLVNNALVYTDVDVDVRLTATGSTNGTELTIADSGSGLRPEDAARIFDRFFRGEQSRARRTGGSGLGLAIAKSIIEGHGGSITLYTEPGNGCRFVITLPNDSNAPPPRSPLRTSEK